MAAESNPVFVRKVAGGEPEFDGVFELAFMEAVGDPYLLDEQREKCRNNPSYHAFGLFEGNSQESAALVAAGIVMKHAVVMANDMSAAEVAYLAAREDRRDGRWPGKLLLDAIERWAIESDIQCITAYPWHRSITRALRAVGYSLAPDEFELDPGTMAKLLHVQGLREYDR